MINSDNNNNVLLEKNKYHFDLQKEDLNNPQILLNNFNSPNKLDIAKILESPDNSSDRIAVSTNFNLHKNSEVNKGNGFEVDMNKLSASHQFNISGDSYTNAIENNYSSLQGYNQNQVGKFTQSVTKNNSLTSNLTNSSSISVNLIHNQVTSSILNDSSIALSTSIITPEMSKNNAFSTLNVKKSSQIISSPLDLNDNIAQNQVKNPNLKPNLNKNSYIGTSNDKQNHNEIIDLNPNSVNFHIQSHILESKNYKSDDINLNSSNKISQQKDSSDVIHPISIIYGNNLNQHMIARPIELQNNGIAVDSKMGNISSSAVQNDITLADGIGTHFDNSQKAINSSPIKDSSNASFVDFKDKTTMHADKISNSVLERKDHFGLTEKNLIFNQNIVPKPQKIFNRNINGIDPSNLTTKVNDSMRTSHIKPFNEKIMNDNQNSNSQAFAHVNRNQQFNIDTNNGILATKDNGKKAEIQPVTPIIMPKTSSAYVYRKNEKEPMVVAQIEKAIEAGYKSGNRSEELEINNFGRTSPKSKPLEPLQNQLEIVKTISELKTMMFIKSSTQKDENVIAEIGKDMYEISPESLILQKKYQAASSIGSNISYEAQNNPFLKLNSIEKTINFVPSSPDYIENSLNSMNFVTPIKRNDIMNINTKTRNKLNDQSILNTSFQLDQFNQQNIDQSYLKTPENSSPTNKKIPPIFTQELYQEKSLENSSPSPHFSSSFRLPESAIKAQNFRSPTQEDFNFHITMTLNSPLKKSNNLIPIWIYDFEELSLVCKIKELLMKEITDMIEKNNSQDLTDLIQKIRSFEQLDGYILKNFSSKPPNMRRCWVYILGMILNVLLIKYLSYSDVIIIVEELQSLAISISLYYYIRQKIFIGERLLISTSVLYTAVKGDRLAIAINNPESVINLPLNESFISLTDKSRIVKKLLYKLNMENLDLMKVMKYLQIIFYDKSFPIQEGSISVYLLYLLLQDITMNIPHKKFYFHTISHIFYMDMQLNFGGGIRTINDLQEFISSFMHKNVSLGKAQFKINNSDLKYQDVNLSTLLAYLCDFLNIHENYLEFVNQCTDVIMNKMKKLESLLVIILILKNKKTLLSNKSSFILRDYEQISSQNATRILDNLKIKIDKTITATWIKLLKDIDAMDSLKLKNENYHCDFISAEIVVSLMSGTFFHQNLYESSLHSLKLKLKLIIRKMNDYYIENQINLWEYLHDHFITVLGKDENDLWNYAIDKLNCSNNEHCDSNQLIDKDFNMKNVPHLPSFNYIHKIIAIIIYITKEDDLKNITSKIKNRYSDTLDIKHKILNKIFYFVYYIMIKIKLARLEFILNKDQENRNCAKCLLYYIRLWCELLEYKKIERAGPVINRIFQYLECLLNVIDKDVTIEIDNISLKKIWDDIEANKMIIANNKNLKQIQERIKKQITKFKLSQLTGDESPLMTGDKLFSKNNKINTFFDKFIINFVQKIYELKKKSSPSKNIFLKVLTIIFENYRMECNREFASRTFRENIKSV